MARTITVPVFVFTDEELLALVNRMWAVGEERGEELDTEEMDFSDKAHDELARRGRLVDVDVMGYLYFK